ncbi:MAG: 16S rRNA (cytidine(1402)-2'-O)-methyltransferase [Ardenticatenia bacterium]|nr:16S rRNA (cytidine(1402)-2'-O)-methyltransferase [Ardenticatenia bacterium]
MGTLYVVGTPIGNLEDITLRALRVLREVDLIAAEDTRRTATLLQRHGIRTRLTSYHAHNRHHKLPVLLRALADGADVALVSDAGMPGISDPGYELVARAVEQGVRVVPVPGPSAVIAALVAAGLPCDHFTFLGFLPRKRSARRHLLHEVASWPHTLVVFEAPHRLVKSLADMVELLGGERRVAVARELTKVHEEFWRGTLEGALTHFRTTPPRGELTLVIEGVPPSKGDEHPWSVDRVRQALHHLASQGVTGSRAVKEVARLARWPRREVYHVWLELQGE